MEQNRESRNKPMQLWSIDLRQRKQEYTIDKTVSSISGAGKTGQLHVKHNEIRMFPHTIYKNKLKMD